MHLKSLQALEKALRLGSLKAAAESLGITPAAVGQRIRALEDFLGNDLLLRGRSGLTPTPELQRAQADLALAFAALERVTDTLDFNRTAEIHVVADPDWADLWLSPRLPAFRAEYPNLRFCINGVGDVPVRLGAPDCRVAYGGPERGEELYVDRLVPVCSHDNLRRIADWDTEAEMEGLPLLHLAEQRNAPDRPGWPDWFAAYGQRRSGQDRGVMYPNLRVALEAVRDDVGFVLCGMSLAAGAISAGHAFLPYRPAQSLTAPQAYRLHVRDQAVARPQMARFIGWLRAEAHATRALLSDPAQMLERIAEDSASARVPGSGG